MSTGAENPYIGTVTRRLRNLKKKMAKIEELEAQAASGKTLVQEQLDVVASKPTVQRSITDIDALATTMLDIEKEEKLKIKEERTKANALKKSGGVAPPSVEVLSEQDVMDISAQLASDIGSLSVDEDSGKKGKKGGKDTAKDKKEDTITTVKIEDSPTDVERRLRKLVKILHVVSKYSDQTGKELPPSVTYFGMSVMGSTSVSDFADTVNQSLKTIGYYIYPEKADDLEIITGVTYPAMSGIVDTLALELGDVLTPVDSTYDGEGDSSSTDVNIGEGGEGGDKKKRKKKKKSGHSETEAGAEGAVTGTGAKSEVIPEALKKAESVAVGGISGAQDTSGEKEKKKKPRPKKSGTTGTTGTSGTTSGNGNGNGSSSVGDKPAGAPVKKEKGVASTSTSNSTTGGKKKGGKESKGNGDKKVKPTGL